MKKTIIVVSIVLFVVLLAGSGSFYYFYYLNGPCGVSKVDNSAKGIAGLMSRWEDAEAIASKTPRMSLSSQISNLQQIKRDAGNLEVPECLIVAKTNLASMMNASIEGYLSFLAQEPSENADGKFNVTGLQASKLNQELTRIKECRPFCNSELSYISNFGITPVPKNTPITPIMPTPTSSPSLASTPTPTSTPNAETQIIPGIDMNKLVDYLISNGSKCSQKKVGWLCTKDYGSASMSYNVILSGSDSDLYNIIITAIPYTTLTSAKDTIAELKVFGTLPYTGATPDSTSAWVEAFLNQPYTKQNIEIKNKMINGVPFTLSRQADGKYPTIFLMEIGVISK